MNGIFQQIQKYTDQACLIALCHDSRRDLTIKTDLPPGGSLPALLCGHGGQKTQIDRSHRKLLSAAVSPCQHQKLGDEGGHFLRLFQDDFQALALLFRRRVRKQGIFCLRGDDSHRCPKLMGSVGGELPLMLKGGFQPAKHFVEGLSQLPDFALSPLCGDTGRQVSAGAYSLRCPSNFFDGKKSAPGDGIAHQKGDSDEKRAGNQQHEEQGAFHGKQGF